MKRLVCCLLMFVLSALSGAVAVAQTSYGRLAGVVTDQTGAVVTGATITATSQGTGETHTVKASNNGGFLIESLGVGIWNVTAEAAGFQKTVVAAVRVDPSVTTSVSAVLKIGNASETVEISSSLEVLQTQSGEISATLGAAEINDLPLSSLNPYALATTLPGVTTVTTLTGTANVTRFSADGFRARENNFLIEGQDNNDAGLTGTGLTPENEEAIDSVTFLLNGNAAEFGRGGGAISNLVIKSGTNEFHGAVFERILNSALNTTDHSLIYQNGRANPKKPNSRENIYGFRIGGPIIRNKLFIFGSQQFDHYRATATLGNLVLPLASPSASGCLSATTAGKVTNFQNLNAYKSNAQIAKLLTAYAGLGSATTVNCAGVLQNTDVNYREISLGVDPLTGLDRGVIQFGTYQRSLGNIQNGNEIDIKSDYLAGSRDKLQLHFIRNTFTTPYDVGNFASQLPNFDTDQHGNAYNNGIVETHVFSPSILNEFRLSFSRIGFTFDLAPGTYANPLLGPTVSIASVTGYGIPTSTPQGRFHNTYQLQDGITFTMGNHSLKAGFDVEQIRVRDAVPFVFYGAISYTVSSAYSGLANYMDDVSGNNGASSASVQKFFGSNLARPTLNNQAYYIQDHWKAARNLTVDAGLRYEYYGAPFNYLAYPAIDPANLSCFQCRVEVKPNYRNFGPRLGFAYTPFDSAKTVVRGATGMFYDNIFTNIADNLQASSPNAATPVLFNSTTGRGTAAWSTQFANLNTNPLATNTLTSVVPNLRNPYTLQFNLSVEQQLPAAMSLTASYIGTRGVHLYALDYLNPTIPGTSTRFSTTARGPITVHDNTGDSEYSGASLDLQRKFRANALMRIVYTYSKSMDDVSDDYSSGNYSAYPQVQQPFSNYRGTDWGPSALDHKQRAVLSMFYSVPVWHTNGFKQVAAALTNNIQISSIVGYQSGSVVNIQSGIDWNGDGITNDRPVVSNPSAPLNTFAVLATDQSQYASAGPNVYCDGTYILNFGSSANNFCHPVSLSAVHFFLGNRNTLTNNTIRRNAFYAPGTFQNDFTAGRAFKIREGQDFLIRAECFNCMNHANTGIPNATLESSGNVIPTSTSTNTFVNYAPTAAGARTLRFFARYEF